MSKERAMIELLNREMPRSSRQINGLFECDAEIINEPLGSFCMNIDEFSEEDLLREHDPWSLGWNIAVGCISDILASGGIPKYYAHSLVISKEWSESYVEMMAQGIAQALKEADISFTGGDFGISECWRYTGTVIGSMVGHPLLRSQAMVGDCIFITGKVGLGNIEAALKLYSEKPVIGRITKRIKTQFPLKLKEAALIRAYSKCCIDTSDGLYQALNVLCEQSSTGYSLSEIPYEKSGIVLSKLLNLPKELLFFGECGEYQLVFTIPPDQRNNFLKEAQERQLTFYEIGQIKDKTIRTIEDTNGKIDVQDYRLNARDFDDTKTYLKSAAEYILQKKSER